MNPEHKQLTTAIILALSLANIKEMPLSKNVKRTCNAYTNWNIFFILYRYICNMKEWDSFLCLNSVGIFIGFHTAFTNGLERNLFHKLRTHDGFKFSNAQMRMGDHLIHTFPAILTTWNIIYSGKKIPFITVMYTLTFGTLFAYSQCGKLDASASYVPHAWKRAWLSMLIALFSTQQSVNFCQDEQYGKSIVSAIPMFLPYLYSRFDKKMKQKYTFEYILRRNLQNKHKKIVRRIQSATCFK